MKKITIIFRHAPHGSAKGREGLDFALLSASFEQEVSLIFVDEGVLNLLPLQTPEVIGAKDFLAAFKALPLYDIECVYACHQSLADYQLDELALAFPLEIKSPAEIGELLTQADEVFVY
ncbi:sulfurtransferase complex subunit TusC [Shewanella halotolerans]|uniref:sulfurtransferase complex subunit TusC n=1 Tax=Shewanella halotolerans TaxID=2864204 RepID=UPI001C6551CC|nr:sulfurtransferase complex subunit TusC [Shewanella halotolerans]QYJ91796.1 sulfurtransferase complex subunit TusC [Shewanella halotolerans]